jgi:hypothetical protein
LNVIREEPAQEFCFPMFLVLPAYPGILFPDVSGAAGVTPGNTLVGR